MRNRRGLTQVELLIGATLSLIVLSMFVWILVVAVKMTQSGSLRAEMQQQAALPLKRMAADLQETVAAGLSILPMVPGQPAALGLVKVDGVSDSGVQQFQTEAVVYYWIPSDKKLWRKRYPPAPPAFGLPFTPGRPVRLTSSELTSVLSTNNGTERLLASSVMEFSIADGTMEPDTIGSPITISIVIQRKPAQSKVPEQFKLSRKVALRNAQ